MSHQTPEACKFSACECAERVPDIFAFKNICIKRQKHVRPSDADSEAARRNILPVGRTGRGGGRGGGAYLVIFRQPKRFFMRADACVDASFSANVFHH